MLTFRQLRGLIRIPDKKEKTPRAKELQSGDAKIVVREMIGPDSSVTVYDSGYVLYQAGGRSATFPFPREQEYLYEALLGVSHIPVQFWENESWYIGLILFGEDRLAESNEKRETQDGKAVSYSAFSEDWKVLADRRRQDIERMIQRMLVEEALSFATEKQRWVLFQYYLQNKPQKVIAAELGISRRAVTNTIRKGIERIRRAYGIPTKGVKRGKYNHS